jgi:hypothetical protein
VNALVGPQLEERKTSWTIFDLEIATLKEELQSL